MARSGDRGDLLTAGLGLGTAKEQVALKISDDATWVAAAQDGDRSAFGQLYERYPRMVPVHSPAGPVLLSPVLSPISSSTNELKLCGLAFAHGTITVTFYNFEMPIPNCFLSIPADRHGLASQHRRQLMAREHEGRSW